MLVLWINKRRALPSAFVLGTLGASEDQTPAPVPCPSLRVLAATTRVITEVIYSRACSTPSLTASEHHLQEPASGTGLANATSLQFLPLSRPPAGPAKGPWLPDLPAPPLRIGRAHRGQGSVRGSSDATPRSPTLSWRPNSYLGSRKVLGQGQLEMSRGSQLPWGEPSEGPHPRPGGGPHLSHSEGSQGAGPPRSLALPLPRLPATLRFWGLLRKAPEPPWLSLLSWAWRGEWAGSRAVPQETSPPHLVSQGWRVVVLGPDLGCHGGIRHGGCERHRQPFPTRPAGPGLQGTADGEVSEVAFQNNGASACLHSGQDKQ